MSKHAWMVDVLLDIEKYATKNAIQDTLQTIRSARQQVEQQLLEGEDTFTAPLGNDHVAHL